MRTTPAFFYELEGSPTELGQSAARHMLDSPALISHYRELACQLPAVDEARLRALYQEHVPHLLIEIDAFAEALNIPFAVLPFNALTFLNPGCSQLGVQGHRTDGGNPLLIRNFDFSDQMDDMAFVRTIPQKGQGFTHIGSSLLQLGRSDGMNEKGLCVSMSACGMPVGNQAPMRQPSGTGLQFWVVLRHVLESCATVEEALSVALKMPLMSNVNLLFMDASNHLALLETFDGRKSVRHMTPNHADGWLSATNHILQNDLKLPNEKSLVNSHIRHQCLESWAGSTDEINHNSLQTLFSTPYPAGLSAGCYASYFGTLRSLLMDPVEQSVELRFGSPDHNHWHRIGVNQPLECRTLDVVLVDEPEPDNFFDFQ